MREKKGGERERRKERGEGGERKRERKHKY